MKCIVCEKEFHSPDGGGLVPICSHCVMGNNTAPQKPKKKETGTYEDMESLQSLFPDIELLEKIGSGGMGAVYKARQKSLDRIVAVKVLNPKLEGDPEFEERFQREAMAMAMLQHPNIVGIYDFGLRGDIHFLLMEFVDGQDLQKLIKSNDLNPDRAFSIIRQLCSALHFAHGKGVVHRDIKPGNILIDNEGTAKIGDFGLARISLKKSGVDLTITQSGMGTPAYVAPEQLEDAKSIDSRADIYALGVVVYEMLTGQIPGGNFPSPTSRFPRPNKRLDETILKAMEPNPDRRIADVRQIAECLDAYRFENPEKLRRSTVSRKSAIAFIAVGLLAGAIIAYQVIVPPKNHSSSIGRNEDTEISQLLPPIRNDATRDFLEKRKAGGRLRKWEQNPNLVDISAAAGINDLISVRGMRTTAASWSAARSTGEMISAVPIWNRRNDYVMVQTSFWIESPNRLTSLAPGQPKFLPLLEPVNHALDIAQNDKVAVIATADGKVKFAAEETWVKSHQFVIERISSLEGVIAVDAYAQLVGVLTDDGKPHVWHETWGFLEPPESQKQMVQLELGGSHALGLYEDGSLVTWTLKRNQNSNHERLKLALSPPPVDEPMIRIEAFDFVNAAQRRDGTWVAWGSDSDRGLIDQINSLGVALDLELFSINLAGAKMVWIEPAD